MQTIDSAEITGKRVLVRVDWNVTLGKAIHIVDDTRITKTLPTIKLLLEGGAKQIILMSHLGKAEEKRSLAPVAEYASKLLGREIKLFERLTDVPLDQLVMMENLRLWEGEEGKTSNQYPVGSIEESQKLKDNFARELSALGDIYVNEAFGESHREAASIVGMPKILPSYAGLWFAKEVETILKVRDKPERPMVVVMGGAKVEDKIKLLEVLSRQVDTILLGGKLANEYVSRGLELGGSAAVMVPVEGSDLLDIGPETQNIYAGEIAKAKTVVWNGPMGMVEDGRYRAGTEAIYEAMIKNESAYTLVGGGDTLAAIRRQEHLARIDHVSTGGGAMLKLMEAGTLVGIEALNN